MTPRPIWFALAFAAGFDFSTAAAEPPPCGPRADIVSQLGSKYSEAATAVGLAANGALVEVFTSADGSTWTIFASSPDGYSCLLAAGESWQDGLQRVEPGIDQ